ncbi:pentatricopeptide repeat-containing protein At2g02750-like [Pistacia vera]|uniref:pentatricopeptide repeat-containing protein At2g02750-like n=1 Tax=Pistacia vera TaxID=55513 RepID=UPI001263D361|nr:pentatricopeptide repeat-containing protein At2g02750-like [Pistacia vera]
MKHQIPNLVKNGFYKEALYLYAQHHSASLPPQNFTFPPLLKVCAKLQSPIQGRILHTHLIKTGFSVDVYSATALGDMYMKLNLLGDALKAFDEMPQRNLASLNAVISGYSQNGYSREGMRVFKETLLGLFRPNAVTVASVLSGCDSVEDGTQMHCLAIKLGVDMDIYVATALLTMYSNCKEIGLATRLFGDMRNKNVVSYNAFVTGLLHNGVPREALDVFREMRECLSEEPNSVSLTSVISACVSLLNLQLGRQIHGLIVKLEMEFDTMVGTALIDMYSKCGRVRWAYDVFKELNGRRNFITWNSMIAGMMLNNQTEKAIELFEQLEYEGLEPDSATWNSIISGFAQLGKGFEAFTYFKKMQLAGEVPSSKCVTSLLSACADMAALKCGKEIHGHFIRTDIGDDDFLCTALIFMYMKCGFPSAARRVFDQIKIKPDDPAFWNAMVSGYGRNGEFESAVEIFDLMQEEKVKPNSATFVSILSACSHTGQVEKGLQVFRMMSDDYGINPNPEHVGCLIDLLGRSGRLDEAEELIQELSEPSASIFYSLLGACWSHMNSKLGEETVMKLSELEPENPTPFVVLSNIYAVLQRWENVERTRQMVNDRALRKLPGISIGVT